MAEIKFKKPRRKMERKTTVEEDSDEDRSDDESFKFVLLNIRLFRAVFVRFSLGGVRVSTG